MPSRIISHLRSTEDNKNSIEWGGANLTPQFKQTAQRDSVAMFAHSPEFYEAIALGIEAENRKASVYIKHSSSLGTARENILRNVLADATPAPFRLGNGLIHGRREVVGGVPEEGCSRQCDVIIYNPTVDPPKYAFHDFVVLHPGTAQLVVEVKSSIDQEEFGRVLATTDSVARFRLEAMVFAYDSVSFGTMSEYYRDAYRKACDNSSNPRIPAVTYIYEKDILIIRPLIIGNNQTPRLLLINLAMTTEHSRTYSTGYFLQLYNLLLRSPGELSSNGLYQWFNGLSGLPDAARISITNTGIRCEGEIKQF